LNFIPLSSRFSFLIIKKLFKLKLFVSYGSFSATLRLFLARSVTGRSLGYAV
jgi:hypothetical protein